MAKLGDFGSMPDGLFGELVQEIQKGAFATPQDRIDALAELAKAAQASAAQNLEPNIIDLTIVCIDVRTQLDILQSPAAAVDKVNALKALVADFKKLAGLWKS